APTLRSLRRSGGDTEHVEVRQMRHRIRQRELVLAIALSSGALSVVQAAPLTEVPNPNPKLTGITASTLLSPELRQSPAAEGAMRLENPAEGFEFYGFGSDGPHVPPPGALPSKDAPIEATKTEPDKNTYLVLHGLHGADPNYDYGTHFLYQGHENATAG